MDKGDSAVLRICHRQAGAAHVVEVAGEIDAGTAAEFRRELAAAAVDSAELVVVDLSEVRFIDSAGVTVLAGLHRRGRDRGVSVKVVTRQYAVKRVLGITGLDELIPVVDDLAEALPAG
ncbi:STAS domain-containing protein [Amycolatopsis mongoliensis]|uniref:Anti-sigma factor antagonist n=1 Tax=Amycolatopsis mongoliensis TaxID=715475 RepID=A0A9Y2JXJ6_9PSEU|nr:STAS domain-containing protein [Amycolatopsis sp. 4-36]WIY06581.1 STAS domain-containing protein [Amycolatopsis sp. 4-36]